MNPVFMLIVLYSLAGVSGVKVNNQLRQRESVCEIYADGCIVEQFRKCRFNNKLTKEKIIKEKKELIL
jgi:hypothetical protein